MRVCVLRTTVLAILAGALGFGPARAQIDQRLKLYVTNSEGDDITVIDLGRLKVIGNIKVGDHVHGAAVQADGRRLYTTVESDQTLKVIDTATDRIIDTIKLTQVPNQCAVTPNGRYVGVPIRGGDSVDIVGMTEKKVVKNLPVRVPHNCYNAHNNDHMFVTSMGDHQVNLIDLKTMTYIAHIPVGGVPRPLAVSSDETRMYVALSDLHGFVIVDIPHRRVLEKVELPAAPAGARPLVAYTPTHGLDLTPDGKELWVTSMVGDGVYVYDIATKKLSEKIPTGRAPNWLTFSPDGRYCCVSNAGSDDCSIIDAKTRREVTRLKVGKMPKRLVVANAPSNPIAAPAP